MFWLVAKKITIEDIVNQGHTKLEGDSLVEAVKKVQDHATSATEKNKAFHDLLFTFKGLILKKYKAVNELAHSQKDHEDIIHHLSSSFYQILTELTPKSAADIVGYIAHKFNTQINKEHIKQLLGHGETVSGIAKYKYKFRNALRDFHKQYKRAPDFNKIDPDDEEDDLTKKEESDLSLFAKILGSTEEQALEVLKLFGSDTIKSMSDDVTNETGEGDNLTLGDTLKSNEPLPDEVLEDSQNKKIILDAIKAIPDKNQQRAIMMYYLYKDPVTGKEIELDNHTSDAVAEKMAELDNITDPAKIKTLKRNVRHWVAMGRKALEANPKMKEQYVQMASFINELVKEAFVKQFVKAAISGQIKKSSEDLIFEVVASCVQ